MFPLTNQRFDFPFHQIVWITFLSFLSLTKGICQTAIDQFVFTPQQLQEDFQYMRLKLERYHPNLYLYASKAKVDSTFDVLYTGLETPMTSTTFYKYLGQIHSVIRDGHNIILPSGQQQAFHADSSLYFPLNVAVIDNKFIVTQNFSDDNRIQPGNEILVINERTAMEVFDQMVHLQVRDGHNLQYPIWLTQTYFRSFYGFMFGFPESYPLTIRTQAGDTYSTDLKALPYKVILERRTNHTTSRYDRQDHDKGIFWQKAIEDDYMLLNIRTWHSHILKSDYQQKFTEELKQFYIELLASGVSHLIIDLRGNQGGDGWHGQFLMRCLMDRPFNYFFAVRKRNIRGHLVNVNSSLAKTVQPQSDTFKGDIFILTDGGSFSNSAIFATLMSLHKRATIVGSETGGNNSILAGGDGYHVLPYTQIQILKVTRQMVISDQIPNTGRGLMPDVVVHPTLDQIIRNEDAVMQKTLSLIRQE